MSYAAFLSGGTPRPAAAPRPTPNARGRAEAGSHCMLAMSRTEVEYALAALSRTGAATSRPRAAALPPVVDAVIRFAGAIAHREVAAVDGRRGETGRVLTGVAALTSIAADLDAYGEHRAVRIDLAAVSRALSARTTPVRAFEDRAAWEGALEATANRTDGLRRAASMRLRPQPGRAAAAGIGR